MRLNEKEQDGVSTSRLVVRSKAVMRVGNVLCGPGYNYMQLHTITDNYIQTRYFVRRGPAVILIFGAFELD